MFSTSFCGFNSQHKLPCDIYHEQGLPEFLMVMVRSPAWFIIDGEKVPADVNTAIIYSPHTPIHYGCEKAGYNDDWIHFTCTEDDWNKYQIPVNTLLYPAQIQSVTQYVKLLTGVHFSQEPNRMQMIDHLMHLILYSLTNELYAAENLCCRHKHYPALSKLRTSLHSNPADAWTTELAAKKVNLSVSYFQHLYKEFFNRSFQTDFIQARMDFACFHLTHSNMTIAALAGYCGYDSEIHFMKQFKKIVGLTPTAYRKQNGAFETLSGVRE